VPARFLLHLARSRCGGVFAVIHNRPAIPTPNGPR
jgi:hypothetical protein